MSKNIVICCDGTGNKLDIATSNVLRLFQVATRKDSRSQVAFYHPGIGTMPAKAALNSVSRGATKLAGSAVGYGLFDDVADLYANLIDAYEEGDKVFLFGFSRGAFTMRVLAGVLHRCHLLRPEFKNLIRYAFDLYRPHDPKESVVENFRTLFARPCRVHFLGLWDTVKAYGVIAPRSLPHLRFNDSVDHVRHALALEERRTFFAPTTWGGLDSDTTGVPPRRIPAGQDLREVWFAGCHSDVGGGDLEALGGLYKQPLEWMVREAQACELHADEHTLKELLAQPAGPDRRVESLEGWWNLAEICPRLEVLNQYDPPRRRPTMGLWRGRALADFVRDGHLIVHDSVPESLLRGLQRGNGTHKPFEFVPCATLPPATPGLSQAG